MYSLPRIIDPECPVKLPTCMYAIPRIVAFSAQESQNKVEDPSMEDIETRQESILSRLKDLHGRVSAVRKDLDPKPVQCQNDTESLILATPQGEEEGDSESQNAISPQRQSLLLNMIEELRSTITKLNRLLSHGQQAASRANYGKLVDLVILSSPSNPPYSLQCMISDLKQKAKFTVRTATHCHSSVTEPLSANLLDFFPDDEGQEVADPNMKVTIIWKKMSCDPRLTVKSRQISGEGNIARYLARLFPEIFTYENLKNDAAGSATQTDDWLDAAHAAFLYGDAAKEEAFLQRMKIALTNRKVLVGPGVCPSIADYVVWSLIKGRRDDSRLEPVLQPWAKSCRESATGRKYDDSRVGPNASSPSRGKKHENSRKSSSTVDKSGSSTKQVSASRVEDKKTRILSLLSSIGVNEVDVVEHPPVTTVESMMTHLNEVDGAVTKNFFLRDKGKSLFLMTAKHNHQVDLGAIGKQLGIKDLRFGPEELMEQKLGVKKGCLSLLALANDREKQEVKLLMDESLLEGSFARVYMHPLVNDCSVGISKEGLSKFLEHISHPPVLLKFT